MLFLAPLLLSSSVSAHSQDSLVLIRVNSSPVEHVLHYHGVPPADSARAPSHASAHRDGRHSVKMHTNQPVSDVACVEGDVLTVVHSSFPGQVVKVTVGRVGAWFGANFPAGSTLQTAAATIRLMLVSYGPQSRHQLVTTDYDELVADANEANLGHLLPHDLKQEIRQMPPEERADRYKQHLGDRWPILPTPDEKDL